MQAITWTLCNAKMRLGKHDTSPPTYKETKKKFPSTNNVEDAFWFCHDGIKRCVSGNKYEHVQDWFKGEIIGARVHHVPIVAKGGIFALL